MCVLFIFADHIRVLESLFEVADEKGIIMNDRVKV